MNLFCHGAQRIKNKSRIFSIIIIKDKNNILSLKRNIMSIKKNKTKILLNYVAFIFIK